MLNKMLNSGVAIDIVISFIVSLFYQIINNKLKLITMTIENAMTYCFNDEAVEGENRKWFSNKEAAEEYSKSLKHLWSEGLGQMYGPFVNSKVTQDRWWEVSYR